MGKPVYTDEHLAFLQSGYMTMNPRGLAQAFNARFGMAKTESQIKSTISNHGITCGRAPRDRFISRRRLFTDEQVRFVRDSYKDISMLEMAALLNDRFGTNRTREQIKCLVANRHITSGRTGCFPKGNKSWNTGTKGLTGANKTSFKKGHVPANYRPIGHERICPRDGFIFIKIPEHNPYTGSPTRYKHKHVHVWEQAHGPVPKGMVVAFVDGVQTHCEEENLMLISRRELLNLNRHRYKEMLPDVKPSVLALSKLELKMWNRGKP
jgi:hypothetical protein